MKIRVGFEMLYDFPQPTRMIMHDHRSRASVSGPRPADHNIAVNAAEEGDGLYRPGRHLERIRNSFERRGKEPEAYVRAHIRRLEALRRAGHAERIDAERWKIPEHCPARTGLDLSRGGDGFKIRTLSTLNLDQQIGSDGAIWLDRWTPGSCARADARDA